MATTGEVGRLLKRRRAVPDDNAQARLIAEDLDRDRRTRGMFADVGQGFLDRAVSRALHVVRPAAVGHTVDLGGGRQSRLRDQLARPAAAAAEHAHV